jgi:hypothetical protein
MHTVMPWWDGSMAGLSVIVLFVAYFLPWVIASLKGHPDRTAIGVLNLFLGWTFLGWVGALVWAFVERGPGRIRVRP